MVEAMGGLDKLLETLRQRLKEQKGRHQGGSKWIGTAGTSPFGAYGYNPEGVRIGQDESRHKRAVKVWDKREFRDLDGDVELGTRNIKVALRRLRKFARTGAPEELDLDGTIKGTAHKGYLDILMRPERHNAVKVLLFFDIGGSMDWHIKATEELFSAARTEFKHMEHFYFHNCLYEKVWKENRRRWNDTTPTWDLLHTFPHDYKVIFVGDASMSPYEIAAPGGSVEHIQRGGRPRLDGARDAHLSGLRVAQSGAGRRVGLYPVDPHDAATGRRADVSADAGGIGPGDAGIGAVARAVRCCPSCYASPSGLDAGPHEIYREDAMKRLCAVAALAAGIAAFATPAAAQGAAERLYVMECGQGAVPDLSRWSPGVNVGVKTEYVTNCYLVRHAKGWLLWETGAGDDLVNVPEGRGTFTRWRLKRTLASQLAEIGVKPDDVNFIAASHTHFDHIGNVNLFPKSVLLMQKAEYQWPLPKGGPRFNPAHPVTQLEGDHDVFGDGSAVLLATPGTRPATSRSCCG